MTTWPDWMLFEPKTARNRDDLASRRNAQRDVAREVLAAIAGISLFGPAGGIVWRGHGDVGWRLTSKAGRLGFTAADMFRQETTMLEKARKIGADSAQYMGDWEILARLRHHGAATRLIDCTTDPFVALWFLCDDDTDDVRQSDGLLLALQRKPFVEITHPYASGNYQKAFEPHHRPARLIYTTPPIDVRIAAQRGVFVLHTDPKSDATAPNSELGEPEIPTESWRTNHKRYLDQLCASEDLAAQRGRLLYQFPDLIGVVIPAAVKPILLEMLEGNFGFTRETMFPDFSGMGEFYSEQRT
jgi:hypothetical protein